MGAPFIFVILAWVAMAPFVYAAEAVFVLIDTVVNTVKKAFGFLVPDTEEETTEVVI